MALEKIFSRFNSKKEAIQNYDNLNLLYHRQRFRSDLLSDKDKGKLSAAIAKGEISDLNKDSNKIADILGRKEYARVFHESMRVSRREDEQSGNERCRELAEAGKDREPLVLEGAPISFINVHGMKPAELAALGEQMPAGLDSKLVDVTYQENTSSDAAENLHNNNEGITEVADSSGRISRELLADILGDNEEAAFIMTGGNLRGCFLSAIDSLLRAARDAKHLKKVDIHIPLDKCYDDDVYGKLTGFDNIREAISSRLRHESAELYEDRRLVGATGRPGDMASKYRIYSWSDHSDMFGEFRAQSDLKSIRESIKGEPGAKEQEK